MSEYLNKIGLLKYNNSTYQQVGQIQYYKVRDPQLVSSDPRINFFNYPWKSDEHWIYNNLNQGWFYNGKEEIAFTFNRDYEQLSSYNPRSVDGTDQNDIPKMVSGGFLYNVIPIQQFLLSTINTEDITHSKLFEFPSVNPVNPPQPTTLYCLSTFSGEKYHVKYDNDNRAYYVQKMQENNEEVQISASTYEIYENGERNPLVLDWVPSSVSPYNASVNARTDISTIVSGYWTADETPICGILYSMLKLHQGSINDIFQNEIHFEVKSPNISGASSLNDLQSNEVEGLFTNIPGTDYITGICTTKMLFTENQYVYMRGLVKGNIEVQEGILQNEIAEPSSIIKKVKIKHLQGTLKNISVLPDEIKYGLEYYYAWGWLHGIDNIKYENVWYKNEISGTLRGTTLNEEEIIYNRYVGTLSVPIVTNNGYEDVTNILTGIFYKDESQNNITGFVEGVIEPYSIRMKGLLTGYYSIVNNTILKPIQLSGVLFNKSVIGDDLRSILDIKYANTLGRKGLTYPDPLHGKKLNFTTKNYDPHNHPYMLQTWKIIEYKTSNEESEQDYINAPINDAIDLNTYIADNKYVQQNYKSRIHRTKEQLSSLIDGQTGEYFVYWERYQKTGDFVIVCDYKITPENSNYFTFKTQVDAQKYIKHLCGQSNLKLKDYIVSDLNDGGIRTKYILESSDLEIR